MIVLDNYETHNSTVKESGESLRSGSFTRVRASEPNPLLAEDEYVYGIIDCPDCEPFRGSTLIGVQAAIPFLNYHNLEIVQKLRSFSSLETDWDSYGASKPSSIAISQAINFVRQLDECGLNVYFVAPGPNGEILVELKKGDKAAEIYFCEDQPAEFVLFPQKDSQQSQELPDSAYFAHNIWRSFIKS